MDMHCNLKAAALVAATVTLSSIAHADGYRWEVGATDAGLRASDSSLDLYGLYGTYYFQSVKTDSLPLDETAYLSRAGSVTLSPSRLDTGDLGNFDQWRLSSELYLRKNWLYLAAGVTRSDTLESSSGGTTILQRREHDTAWDATVGITPFDGLRLSTTYYQHAGYAPNLDVKYVGKLGNDHYFGLGLNLADPDHGDFTYSLSGDYFIDRTLRVGGEFGQHHWGLSADKFFMERLSFGLNYVDRDDGDGHALGLRAAWRF